MTTKLKIILITALLSVAAVCLCLVAGCSHDISLDQLVEENNLRCSITYYLDMGEFDDSSKSKDIFYKPNSKPVNIGVKENSNEVSISGTPQIKSFYGHCFVGWHRAKLDEAGNPKTENVGTEENPEIKYLYEEDKFFDFTQRLGKEEHIYLVGSWEKLPHVNVKLKLEKGSQPPKDLEEGSVLRSYALKDGNRVPIKVEDPGVPAKIDGYTFIGMCEEDGTLVNNFWPQTCTAEDTKDVEIYAKYVQGDWTIVKDKNGVKAMFESGYCIGDNFYFVTDEIDCTGITAKPLYMFQGEIAGNNCVISNLTLVSDYLTSSQSSALFGEVLENSTISNITFSNLNVTFKVRTDQQPLVMCIYTKADATAKFENVEVGGTFKVEMTGSKSEVLMSENHWLLDANASADVIDPAKIKITVGTTCEVIKNNSQENLFTYNG